MFDTTIVRPTRTETVNVPYDKTVTHNYAPTSEQAKHLEDLQKQAWEMVTDKLVSQIDDNFISNVAVKQQHNLMQMTESTHALFTLNDKKFDIVVDTNQKTIAHFNELDSYYSAIAKALSDEITCQIMHMIIKQNPKHF